MTEQQAENELRSRANRLRRAYAAWRERQFRENSKVVRLARAQLEAILSHPDLSATERLVYIMLWSRASRNGEVRLTIGDIARSVGLQERATQLALRKLESAGLVQRLQFRDNRPNNYFLIPPASK